MLKIKYEPLMLGNFGVQQVVFKASECHYIITVNGYEMQQQFLFKFAINKNFY